MDKRFLAILAGLAAVFVGIFVIAQGSSNNKNNSSSSGSSNQPTSHIEGQGKKGVTLIEYGDYQCPVCEIYYQPLKQVYAQFSQDIYFQFRNLPLVTAHPNAFAAARAAEAAGLQNKYWQMHDALYDNQTSWASSNNPLTIFKTYAQQIGLDVNKFTTDYSSSKVNSAINADLAAFQKTGQQQATPTFFLDGKYIDNHQLVDSTGVSVDKFAAIINAEMAQKIRANPANKQ
ncbi:MAG TPA: thioredoxin domain-containing protein [Candidatus Saccharimonadales bacterium]|nr:thioredoxin domain-containing protein [Candidatus Saccharimonadales bacterium]HSX27480.1 thioredoxin domain-containing protein [Patescibacteria group bacterium]